MCFMVLGDKVYIYNQDIIYLQENTKFKFLEKGFVCFQ